MNTARSHYTHRPLTPRSLVGGAGYRVCRVLYRAAVRAVDSRAATERTLHRHGDLLTIRGRPYDLAAFRHVFVIGFGKAAAAMAQGAEAALGERIAASVVVTKYGHLLPTKYTTVFEASHPTPDAAGIAATTRILTVADSATADDLVICLVSGGGSALFECPVEGVTLEDMQATTRLLLHAGAPISALNTVRKHLSAVKGGQLARRVAPATLVTLMLSDVVGDPLDVIASGPTVPDPTTFADALAVLDQYGVRAGVPDAVRRHLERGMAGERPDTPAANDPAFARTQNVIIANSRRALDAAAATARQRGFTVYFTAAADCVEGEACDAAQQFVCDAQAIAAAHPSRPLCILQGGETTVTVAGDGHGGRNSEFALAAAQELDGTRGIVVASLATDGGDGPTDAAGAVATSHTMAQARALGLDAATFLARNDAYTFFAQVGGLVRPGPTGTNVNDMMVALIE